MAITEDEIVISIVGAAYRAASRYAHTVDRCQRDANPAIVATEIALEECDKLGLEIEREALVDRIDDIIKTLDEVSDGVCPECHDEYGGTVVGVKFGVVCQYHRTEQERFVMNEMANCREHEEKIIAQTRP